MSVPAPIVIFGAGGFGREVAVLVRDIEAAHPGTWDLLGFLDDSLPDSARLEALNLRYLGDRTADLPSGTTFVVAVGAGAPRQAISRELRTEA